MNPLIHSISNYIHVSEGLKADLQSRIKFKSLQKREILFREDQICTTSYFIESGILRLYYLKDGVEISEFFCAENQWVNSPKSFMNQVIDVYNIDVIEDAKVWGLHVNDLLYLFDQYPEMEKYARLDMGSSMAYLMERLAITRFSSAKEKYHHFLETYEDIHHRIPLGMIASYIGISPETLSRLRKQGTF